MGTINFTHSDFAMTSQSALGLQEWLTSLFRQRALLFQLRTTVLPNENIRRWGFFTEQYSFNTLQHALVKTTIKKKTSKQD